LPLSKEIMREKKEEENKNDSFEISAGGNLIGEGLPGFLERGGSLIIPSDSVLEKDGDRAGNSRGKSLSAC